MSDTLTDEHVAWAQDFTGVDIGSGSQAAAPAATPAPAAAPEAAAPEASGPAASSEPPSGGGILDTIGDAVSSVADTVSDVASSVADTVTSVASTVADTVTDVASTVVDTVSDAASTVADTVTDVASTVVDTVSDAASAVVDTVSDVASTVADTVSDAASAVAGVVTGIAGAVADKAGGLIDDAEDLVGMGPKSKKVKEVTDKVTAMSDADLKKLPPADKVQMVKDLLANGGPSDEAKAAQRKIYRGMDLDPDFVKRDDERGDRIADALKGDKDLKAAQPDWGKKPDGDKVKALQKVLAAQSKEYGIPPPEVVIEHNPPKDGIITNGYFDPSDGKLHLNMDPASSVQSFQGAIDLAVHENAHNYQEHLVQQLKDGKIKPGDPDYTQATMFAVNSDPNGYVEAKTPADLPDYQKQPLEEHSWKTGPATAKKILKNL